MGTKVVLVDNHKIVLLGLKTLLEKEADINVVGEAENGQAAFEIIKKMHPDVVVMDAVMPVLNGIEATRRITTNYCNIKVLVLSEFAHKGFIKGMLTAGASGYLLKDRAFEELAVAIRTVAAGETYLTPVVAGTLVREYVYSVQADYSCQPTVLTLRESQVLRLLAEGYGNKDIANELHIDIKTVETHRNHILKKLHLKTTADLIKYAIRSGLTSLDA